MGLGQNKTTRNWTACFSLPFARANHLGYAFLTAKSRWNSGHGTELFTRMRSVDRKTWPDVEQSRHHLRSAYTASAGNGWHGFTPRKSECFRLVREVHVSSRAIWTRIESPIFSPLWVWSTGIDSTALTFARQADHAAAFCHSYIWKMKTTPMKLHFK